jgi:thiamine-phosphate pyrophosphorylase
MDERIFKLTLITNKQNTPLNEYLAFINICARFGITCVQLREKELSRDELYYFGKKLLALLKPFSIPLIINDDLNLCLALQADGLHLGQTDGDIISARKKLGDKKILGLSCSSYEQICLANILPINYVGVGAIFATKNKKDAQIMGLDKLKTITTFSKKPVIALGGINEHNAYTVIKAGAHGIAGIAMFHNTKDPKNITKNLFNAVNNK